MSPDVTRGVLEACGIHRGHIGFANECEHTILLTALKIIWIGFELAPVYSSLRMAWNGMGLS